MPLSALRTVRLAHVQRPLLEALAILEVAFTDECRRSVLILRLTDGEPPAWSAHAAGLAVDVSVHHVAHDDRAPLVARLRAALGSAWTVRIETPPTAPVYLHIGPATWSGPGRPAPDRLPATSRTRPGRPR